ncbi:MAG: T9SS type A sorting domain-containing protein, partial [Flavobacteriales bacterium]|nr:T9SS type A sorting domain-containing protein [Flavobacteriales bacterium]
VQNYNTPGDYYPELTTTVYNYVLTDVTVTAAGSGWCGDVEEISFLGVCQGAPDLFFDYANDGETFTSNWVGNNLTASWSNLGIELNSLLFSMTFWDDDDVSQNDNLGALAFSVSGTGTFNFSNDEVFGTYTIGTVVDQTIVTTDTVSVFPVPAQPTLSYSPSQQVCAGDSILVDGPAGPYQYQWLNSGSFVDDSSAIWVNSTGWYSLIVIDTTYFCGTESDSALVEILAIPQPPILSYNSTSGNIELMNPNGYNVEWYNDGVLVQGETGDTLPTNGAVGPFSATFANAGLCFSSQSTEYWVCIPASATPLANDTVCCGETVTFEAPGFATNPFTTVAWAITPQSAGPVVDQASATVAGNNGDIVIEYGESVTFTRSCPTLNDSVVSGNFYVTPFAIEDPNVTPLTYDTLQGCAPYAEICPTLDAADDNWEIFPMVFTFPDGSQLNVNDAIAFGLPIDQQLLDFATGGTLPCLNLTDLFAGNPNGQWSISVTNTGTTAMDVAIPDFVVINFADSCNLITEDESYLIEGLDVTIGPGQTVVETFNIPPLPGDFPAIANNCAAFGDPILVTFADCYPELTNTMTLTGTAVNPVVNGFGNYIFGYIDVTVTGGNPPITFSWADGPTTEDRFNLQPGTYTITATDATGFQLSETFILTGPYLGVDELEAYGFSLGESVPNPTTGNSVISFQSKERGAYQFIVRDATGRMVSSMNLNSSTGENRIIFDGSSLSSGVYTYTLSNGESVLSRRLVINK